MAQGRFEISWIDRGDSPRHPPNPDYPNGIDFDCSKGAAQTCTVDLPYPAPRCGWYVVKCRICGSLNVITTAGRPDDPRSIKFACESLIKA
jgi:hypothetical protein